MRCPKCGFISFDHLDACLKCKKDIKSASENLPGTVYKVAAPAFLKFNIAPETDEVDLSEAFIDDEDVFADDDIRDPDLDILIEDSSDDGEGEVEFRMDDDELEDTGIGTVAAADESEDGGIVFNLNEFDDDVDFSDDDESEGLAEVASQPVAIELPDELSDMSDLEPPPALREVAEEAESTEGLSDDFDLDLDFDLNLDDDDLGAVTANAKSDDLADLSLDGLDFDDEPKAAMTKKKDESRKMDFDDDMNFDLDLGDLRLDEDDKF